MKTPGRLARRNLWCVCALLAISLPTLAHADRPGRVGIIGGATEQPACPTGQREIELFEAIKQKDSARVKALLAARVSPNARSEIKYEVLLSEPPSCAPALMHAARVGDVKTVEALLAAKADVRARDSSGRLVWGYALGYDIRLTPPEQLQDELNVRLQLSRVLVAASAPLGEGDPGWGETALYHAASVGVITGDLRVLNALLAAGAPVNVNTHGISILAYVTMTAQSHEFEALSRPGAKAVGAVAVMERLLRAGADVNGRAQWAPALVMEARQTGLPGPRARLKVLIAAGADPNAQDNWTGETPLLAALKANHMLTAPVLREDSAKVLVDPAAVQAEVVALLLKSGADPNRKDKSGDTPLHAAVRAYYTQAADAPRPISDVVNRLLSAGADVNARDAKGRTALLLALTTERVAAPGLVKLLMAAGADVNAPDHDKLMPLWAALNTYAPDNDEVIETLLGANGDSNSRDSRGRTPLMEAIYRRPKTVQLLIKAGADINARDPAGDTALSLALKTGRSTEYLQPLLTARANLGLRYESGDTALILAAKAAGLQYRRDADIDAVVRALLSAGADVQALNDEGESALTVMVMRPAAAGIVGVRALLEAMRGGSVRISPRAVDLMAAIKRAAGRSRGDIVQKLITAGADANSADELGRPALVVAVAESGSAAVVRALLAGGARVNARDRDGDTSLTAAVREYLPGGDEPIRRALRRDPEVIRALLDGGADTRARGKDGRDALSLAKASGNELIIGLIKAAHSRR